MISWILLSCPARHPYRDRSERKNMTAVLKAGIAVFLTAFPILA